MATLEEIQENEFNLNIPRYVDTFEEEAEVDINKVQTEIDTLEKELAMVQVEMDKYLKELYELRITLYLHDNIRGVIMQIVI